MEPSVWLLLIGGLGFLLYGIHLAGQGLERIAHTRIKSMLETISSRPTNGVLLGFVLTALMQSSTAVSVLLVGFVRASLLTPAQALTVLLGSGVGSTVAVQLIAFKVTDYALLLVTLGGVGVVFARRSKSVNAGCVVLGIGLVFYGMSLMVGAVEPLRALSQFPGLMLRLSSSPLQGIAIAAVFAAVVHSSAATVALIMALSIQGDLGLATALPLIIGANVGTTATALVSSLAGSRDAKRVALANVLFKLCGALLVVPFLGVLERLVMFTAGDVARQVAHAHTVFNLVVMIAFMPLVPGFSRLARRILPAVAAETPGPLYLDAGVIGLPDVAFGQVRKEILRMAETVRRDLMSPLLSIVKMGNPALLSQAQEAEDTLDVLYRSIVGYLAALSQNPLSSQQSEEEVKLLYISNDLEHLGDTCIQLASIVHKTQDRGMELSREGWGEIEDMYHLVEAGFDRAISAFASRDTGLARRVILDQPSVVRLEKRLRYSHALRIQDDVAASKETSEIHMDLINGLLRINLHSVSIAQAVMGII